MTKPKRQMTDFMKVARKKGYTQRTLADRWGYKNTQSISKIAANPSQRDLDALRGAPDISIDEDSF